MIDKKALRKLKNELPHGSSLVLQERIKKDYNLIFTAEYIRAVLDPDNPRMNTIILDEAIRYYKELNEARDRRNSEILGK